MHCFSLFISLCLSVFQTDCQSMQYREYFTLTLSGSVFLDQTGKFYAVLLGVFYLNSFVVVVVIELTGYGGFAVVNTTVVVVEKNIPVLFKIEFYSNPVLNLFIF